MPCCFRSSQFHDCRGLLVFEAVLFGLEALPGLDFRKTTFAPPEFIDLLAPPPRLPWEDFCWALDSAMRRDTSSSTCCFCSSDSWPHSAIQHRQAGVPSSAPMLSNCLITGMPSTTFPKIQCLPSSQGVFAVVMKIAIHWCWVLHSPWKAGLV